MSERYGGGYEVWPVQLTKPNGIRCQWKMEMKEEQKKSPMNFCWRIINDVGGESFRDEKLNFCFDERLIQS